MGVWRENIFVQKHHTWPRNLTDNLEQSWQRKMDMSLNVWGLYREQALGLVAKEIEKYRMDLVGVPTGSQVGG